jgi:hypothetical protein
MTLLESNPLALLTYISAPAVLTNASCVLLFGTGNRYGRAIDRFHTLAAQVDALPTLDTPLGRLRVTQMRSAEQRSVLLVRALSWVYVAVAAFVTSTLVSLVAAIAGSAGRGFAGVIATIALVVGTVGVGAMVWGASLLVRETRSSVVVLAEENALLTSQIAARQHAP